MARRRNALSDGDRSQRSGAGCLILFGLAFGGFGSLFVVLFFVLPLWRALEASDWVEVPCTILESRVGESSDSDGTTYRVEVRFAYHFRAGDLEHDTNAPYYESTRYDFSDGIYSSDHSDKQAEVARLAPGTMTTCRVDPQHPDQAVLRGGLPDDIWFGLIPLVFPAFGLLIIVFGLRMRRTERLRREGRLALSASATTTAAPTAADVSTGPVSLRSHSRGSKAAGLGCFALIWNGITWTIMGFAILPGIWEGGVIEWFPLVFLSIFALIGLIVIGAFLHQLLALANPRLNLTISRGALRPGEWLELEWECVGNPLRITSLVLTFEGQESATYTRGTDTVTDTHLFARLPLVTLDDSAAMAHGRTRFQIPGDAVPTFIATHNKLEWRLTVRGTIPRWPDISDDYPVTILPARTTP